MQVDLLFEQLSERELCDGGGEDKCEHGCALLARRATHHGEREVTKWYRPARAALAGMQGLETTTYLGGPQGGNVRQTWITRKGGPEVLELRDAPDPTPQSGQVRIRVRAAGVNFAELLACLGLYPDAPRLPFVPGYEVAGEIDGVGPGVDTARLGQRVLALTRL